MLNKAAPLSQQLPAGFQPRYASMEAHLSNKSVVVVTDHQRNTNYLQWQQLSGQVDYHENIFLVFSSF